MTVSVHDVAARLVALQAEQSAGGRGLAVMLSSKLHKLSYLCQAYHLAWYGEPLFGEEILAAHSGPVVDELFPYHRDATGLESWPVGDAAKLSGLQDGTVRAVFEFYSDSTGLDLGRMAKRHVPWLRAREKMTGEKDRPVISTADMGSFYRALLDAPDTRAEYAERFMDRYTEVGARV